MTTRLATSLLFAATLSFSQDKPAAPVAAKKEEKKEASAPASTSASTVKKAMTLEDYEKKYTKLAGLFTVYRSPEMGLHFLLITKEQLDQDFIYFTHSMDGPVNAGHNRGNFGDSSIIRFHLVNGKIEVVKENTRYYFDPEHPLARSAGANTSAAVLARESILAKGDKGYLIAADGLFMGEKMLQVKPSSMDGSKAMLGKLNEAKGHMTAKSFPKNTVFQVRYVFEQSLPNQELQKQEDVADPRYVSVQVQHSLLAMPEPDYTPRPDDARVGYFMTEVDDKISAEAAPRRDFIHRWRLVKQDAAAKTSPPVKPITFWIENTTPVEVRDTIREAGLKWNTAFAKAGFQDAVRMEVQPDDAAWSADDIDYNVLRWTASPKPPFGGYGPSFANPRTGEILGADIMLEYSTLTKRMFSERVFTRGDVGLEEKSQSADPYSCTLGAVAQQGYLRGIASLRLRPADKVDEKLLVKEYLTKLVMHEIGHTLGLNHNFKASHLHDARAIHDRALTERVGLYASVMDYPMINLAPHGQQQGQFFATCVGPYDDWAIQYGYSTGVADRKEELARLEKIASRSHERELAFGNDADDMRKVGSGIDPDAMIYDMSSEPITYSAQRCQRDEEDLAALLKEFPSAGQSYEELLAAYNSIQTDMGNALNAASRFIGGVHVERAHKDQGATRAPYTAVPEEQQRAAMKLLAERAFGPKAWAQSAELLSHLQPQRRGFDHNDDNEDPDVLEGALSVQSTLLSHCMDAKTLRRILNSTLYGNTYTLEEMLTDLTAAVMEGDDAAQPISPLRANLQLDYLNRLLSWANFNGKEANIQGNALRQVSRIRELVAKPDNAYAKSEAQRELILYRIKKELEKGFPSP